MIPLGPVVARSRTKASRATVWAYLTDAGLRNEWWETLQLEPNVGGTVQAQRGDGVDAGAIDVWVAGHALGFTWQRADEERGTAVLVTLRSQGYFTGVTITETGFDALTNGAARADAAGREWNRFVEALAAASLDDDAAAASQAEPVVVEPAVFESAVVEPAALEIAAVEIEGELAEDPQHEAVEIAVEIDAEPAVGDHLELVTGPVEIHQDPKLKPALKPSSTPAPAFEPERELSPGLVPLVLPGPPAAPAAGEGDAAAEAETEVLLVEAKAEVEVGAEVFEAAASETAESEDPQEPDFDTLIRGL